MHSKCNNIWIQNFIFYDVTTFLHVYSFKINKQKNKNKKYENTFKYDEIHHRVFPNAKKFHSGYEPKKKKQIAFSIIFPFEKTICEHFNSIFTFPPLSPEIFPIPKLSYFLFPNNLISEPTWAQSRCKFEPEQATISRRRVTERQTL